MQLSQLRSLALAASVAFGCARATGLTNSAGAVYQSRPPATVRVEIKKWSDVVVYFKCGSTRHRLGLGSSLQDAAFRVPTAALGATNDVSLIVHPVGSTQNYQSPNIMLIPGHSIVDLQVKNVIDHSSVTVAVEDLEEF